MATRSTPTETIRYQGPDHARILQSLRSPGPAVPTLITLAGAARSAMRPPAELLARSVGRGLQAVDLAQVVSRYIGETEKNLQQLFAATDADNWILFFDEGDALFGKRTAITSNHDKYTDQEVSYLQQRFATFRGLILALLDQPATSTIHRPPRHIHVTFPPS